MLTTKAICVPQLTAAVCRWTTAEGAGAQWLGVEDYYVRRSRGSSVKLVIPMNTSSRLALSSVSSKNCCRLSLVNAKNSNSGSSISVDVPPWMRNSGGFGFNGNRGCCGRGGRGAFRGGRFRRWVCADFAIGALPLTVGCVTNTYF